MKVTADYTDSRHKFVAERSVETFYLSDFSNIFIIIDAVRQNRSLF